MDERTLEDLEWLQDLRERGVLSDGEFTSAKGRALGPIAAIAAARSGGEAAPIRLAPGRFDIISELVKGDHATIYKARDRETGMVVVVKVPEPGGRTVEDLDRLAAAAKKIDSPYVVRVIGAGSRRDGMPFLAMEYVEGQSLRSYLTARRALPWRDAFPIEDQILQALEAAHEAGVFHGRLTPAEVLVAPTGGIKVTGFGGVAGEVASPYAAPGGAAANVESDLYAAAGILREMLVGAPDATTAPREVPLEARTFLGSALAADPSWRPATADAARMLLLAPPSPGGAPAPAGGPGPWNAPAQSTTFGSFPPPPGPPPGYGDPHPGYGFPPGYVPPPAGWPAAPPVPYPAAPGGTPGAPDDARAELRVRGTFFTAYPVWAMVLLTVVTFGIFGVIWMHHWHGIMPKRRRDDPGALRAILLLFVPVFGLYWMLHAGLRLCTRMDEELAVAGIPLRTPQVVVLLAALAQIALSVVVFVSVWSDASEDSAVSQIAFYLSILTIVLTAIAVGQLQSRVNALARFDAERGGWPR